VLPEAGTPACDDQVTDSGMNGLCVLCSDYDWHCGPYLYAQCPSGTAFGVSCTDWDGGSVSTDQTACFGPCQGDGRIQGWYCQGDPRVWSEGPLGYCSPL
jgi:hypothetical protein